jgi:hypothetical protein
MSVEKALAEKHYADLASKPFFPALVDYICSGPVCAMVWEGRGIVATGRKMIGATNPLASEPGTIRGDFAVEVRHPAGGGGRRGRPAEAAVVPLLLRALPRRLPSCDRPSPRRPAPLASSPPTQPRSAAT